MTSKTYLINYQWWRLILITQVMYIESLLVTEKVTCRGFQWKELWREVKDPWRTNSKLKQCKHSAFSAKKNPTNIFSSFLTQFFFFCYWVFVVFVMSAFWKKKRSSLVLHNTCITDCMPFQSDFYVNYLLKVCK